MRRLLCVGVILLLGFVGSHSSAEAQATGANRDLGVQLHQNYPNPFNPVTRIPFTLEPELFRNGQPIKLTMRIFSILRQQVAIPTALDHPQGNGAVIEDLEFTGPGRYVAYWDGLDKDGNEVASGLYVVLLEVNGRKVATLKMTVSK